MRVRVLPSVVLIVVWWMNAATVHGQIAKPDVPNCSAQLEQLLLNKRFVARVSSPATADGIDLTLDGNWNQKHNSRAIKGKSLGIAVDEPAVVNQVKLKEKLLEIHLNGGGFGTVGDVLLSSEYQRQTRSSGTKASGGSRVNLRFNRPIACDELTGVTAMMAFLAPLLDVDALKVAAAQQDVAPEWAEAAAQRQVLVGMDKSTVFAIMGDPKQKQVVLATDPPAERRQFDLPNMKTRVVIFAGGRGTEVDDF